AEELRVEEGLGLSSCAFHLPANDNATPPTSRAGSRKGEQCSLDNAQDVASAVRQERMSQGVRLFALRSGYPRPSRRQGGASDARSEERGGGLLHLNGDGNRLDADDLALARESAQTGERVGGEKLVWKYITSDHLGGASHITDSNGDLISHQRFHPYGKVESRRGERAWRGGYIGKDIEPDAALGLQRIGARYYAPELGRWVSADPVIGQNGQLMARSVLESNLTSYAGNNPIRYLDSSGLTIELPRAEKFAALREQMLRELQSLTNIPLAIVAHESDGFGCSGPSITSYTVEIVGSTDDESLAAGNKLVRAAIEHTGTIRLTSHGKGKNHADAPVEEALRNRWGEPGAGVARTWVVVDFDSPTSKKWVGDSATGQLKQESESPPRYITLGHELIHGLRQLEGLAVSDILGWGQYRNPYAPTPGTWEALEEAETIGIPVPQAAQVGTGVTENDLRAEHGLEERMSHVTPKGKTAGEE
ncbi:MAG: M91 family zinc metallopeptidase, partial [Polyangiaceae bacterium]|nr:M91 family zinc metallopeptidase [Polyangiaceae bacterium]